MALILILVPMLGVKLADDDVDVDVDVDVAVDVDVDVAVDADDPLLAAAS
jgi:hypothetical protein